MYTLREIRKGDRMNAFNQSLGDNYHLIDRRSEAHNELRERHFGAMGFSPEEIAGFNNPFVVGNNYSLPIYLNNGSEYYIMTESGKTFENLSGLVNDEYIKFSNEKEGQVETLKGGVICAVPLASDDSSPIVDEEDVLRRPTNYSLYQIFTRLKFGRKAGDQLMLQELIDVLDMGEAFAVMPTSDFDYYNNLVSRLIEKHLTTFKEAEDVSYEFKERLLLNRGYSPSETLR